VLYVGELYEVRVSGQQVLTRTSYYYYGGVRVALRVTNGSSVLYYLHTDHPSLRSGQASVRRR
jgi:hypothetical protein